MFIPVMLLVTSAALLTTAPALGLSAATLKWGPAPPFLPAGAQFVVLDGDPSKAVGITLRLRLPAGYQIPAHLHPTQENVTVLSGSVYVGMGDVLDKKVGTHLKAGGFIALPAKMNHFLWTDQATVVQVHLNGPFEITYADPATDPRH